MPKYESNPRLVGPSGMGRVKSRVPPSPGFGQPQPRCHLPTHAVAYPCPRSMAGTVSCFSAMSGGENGPRTPRCSRVRQAYRPVSRAYRVGEQTADGECASVNRTPSAASRSMFGVGIFDAGL